MRFKFYLLLVMMVNFSCTSVHLIRHDRSGYDELNQDIKGHKVTIIKTNKEVIFGENAVVTADSASWLDSQRNEVFIPTAGINEITLKSTWRGVKDGLYYGFLFGAGFGVAVALLAEKKSGDLDSKSLAPLIGIGAGMGGSVWGGMIGAAIGHQDRYILNPPPDSP